MQISPAHKRQMKQLPSTYKMKQHKWFAFSFLVYTTPKELKTEVSEKALNVFRSHSSLFGFVSEKLRQGNHVIIVTSSVSKTSVFKKFSVHTKTKFWSFQIFPV